MPTIDAISSGTSYAARLAQYRAGTGAGEATPVGRQQSAPDRTEETSSVEGAACARKKVIDQAEASLRADNILCTTASSLCIAPAQVSDVSVSALGTVSVSGTMEVEQKERLEAVLQSNRSFLSLYQTAHGTVQQAELSSAGSLSAYA